ncbi:DinB family protein [Bacillus sp. AFS055030]|uniref:DinB family protein n=1 Tax=Bacillus sp. AFS055030 TaxID=2033507 RepID=UPI000BFE427E|nr:DinB family protein [Bacillus sp. AFS055030]PGL70407.1 damage-inducible protein DinB [Bacillus sp. AFS055030]
MSLKEYQWVKENREALLNFCGELKQEDFTRKLDGFGFQSVRETLLHIADCYIAWIGSFILLKTKKPITPKENIVNISLDDIKSRFEQANQYVNELLDMTVDRLNRPIVQKIPWRDQNEEISLTPMKLLVHTITHEYHHKGQIVAMARLMGYIPPNTDVLGTED